jgi:hypothetical protein
MAEFSLFHFSFFPSGSSAPSSRTVSPKFVLSAGTGQTISSYPGAGNLTGNGSSLVFDFGMEVGGIVTINYTVSGSGPGAIGLAFTEAKNWIGESSDYSNCRGQDGALYTNFLGPGDYSYTMPDEKLRGGFRYLTVFLVSDLASVNISNVSLEIVFQPTWSNLRAYQGYFHCDDEMLNSIWYSGAYTLQTNSAPNNTGRLCGHSGWANNGTLGPGNAIFLDGAKRDRWVWPGDMGISTPSTFVSLGDMESVKNALQALYDHQNPSGSLPKCGTGCGNSDTYHMWTMIGTYNYILYTNDTDFLDKNWAGYLKAMTYIYGKVDASGLLEVTMFGDWARSDSHRGHNMSEAQIILYRTLTTGTYLATWAFDTTGLSTKWAAQATDLRNAILAYCWDAAYGAFKDNATSTTLYPQDANSMAIVFGIVDANSSFAQNISARLTENWTPIGAEPPELPTNISPFISSFEIQAHLIAGQTQRALDLIRRSWGWYLNNPNGTGSTVIEGYLTDGTFGYRWNSGYISAEYTSHSHGWSAGPTSALTEFVLGLRVTGLLGISWQFAPQLSELKKAEGGFTTKLGKFQASWLNKVDGYEANVSTPAVTQGELILPVLVKGYMPRVLLDGKAICPAWYMGTDTVIVQTVGGNHTLEVSPASCSKGTDCCSGLCFNGQCS